MKKIKKLVLNNKVIGELQKNEMSSLKGGDLDLSYGGPIDSKNTEQTHVLSCCGGNCYVLTCK